MGVFLALLAMACFAANIILTRYAVARMPVESGFLVVLATNVLFPALLFPVELAVRAAPWSWDWKGAGIFALGGVIGTFLGRRFLFDTVHLLGPARASVFHSTAPAFALVGHTTPLVIFPVSVFLLKNREELTGRTLAGAALVLSGIAALLLR